MSHFNKCLLSLTFAALSFVSLSCRKNSLDTPACANIVAERAPERVIIRFEDKLTGKNLIGLTGLKIADIKVLSIAGDLPLNSWRILPDAQKPPLGSAVEIALLDNKPGKYTYKVILGSLTEVSFEFSLTQHKASSPCLTAYLKAQDFKVNSHEFVFFELNGKAYPEILIVKI